MEHVLLVAGHSSLHLLFAIVMEAAMRHKHMEASYLCQTYRPKLQVA